MSKPKSNSGSQLNAGELTKLPENPGVEEAQQVPPAEEEHEVAEKPKEFKKRVVVSGAEFWTFEPEKEGEDFDGSIFRGHYLGEVTREKDGKKEDQKAGSTIGYNFKELNSGLTFIIGNSHAIKKGLTDCKFSKELLYEIEYLGKGTTAANQPYNRFEFSVLES